MYGKQEDPINPIVSFMLEAHAEKSKDYEKAESLNTAEMETIKKDFINDTLRRGYELWVRAKIVEVAEPGREDAEAMENTLLDKYDYAWNKRCNGPMRKILP